MKKPPDPKGVPSYEFRRNLCHFTEVALTNTAVLVRERNGPPRVALVSMAMLSSLDRKDPLPPEYYAAYCLQPEAALALMKILAQVSSVGAERTVSNAAEILLRDKGRAPSKLSVPAKRIKKREEQLRLDEGRAQEQQEMALVDEAEKLKKVRRIKPLAVVPGMVKDSDVSISGLGKEEK